jgi:enoyl-CoA hydratase
MPRSASIMTPSLNLEGPVGTHTLRGAIVANRLSPVDVAAFREHIATVDARAEILVLQIRAEGKYFCSGLDINQLATSSSERLSDFADLVNALEDTRPVTIAVINGGVYGGGTDLALACDFRIGTPRTEMFVQVARLGVHFYQRAMERFISRLGLNLAKRLLLTGERLDVQAMWNCGFLTHLVSVEEINATVEQLTVTLAGMAPLALVGMKKHLNRIARDVINVVELNSDVEFAARSDDLCEGVTAWRAKRPPRFLGR